jgi:addiction module RelE/StbE family toxin
MKVQSIRYHPDFIKDLKKLNEPLLTQAGKTEERFKENPLHPSLRLHPLKGNLHGIWSISVTKKVRILFIHDGEEIIFVSIGNHDIYQSV